MELERSARGAQLCPMAALPAILNDGAASARERCHSGHIPRIEFRQYREAVEGARARSTAERYLQDIALEIGFLMARINGTIQPPRGRKSTLYSTVLSGFPEVSIVHE
jgi:hypothetical protein